MERFMNHLNLNPGQSENAIPKLCNKKLVLQINEFHPCLEVDLDSNIWLDKCSGVFRKDLVDTPKGKRVQLLLRRRGTAEYKKLKN
ncbi:unnamed protein product [Hymenolepis diminuta]|uniref:Uncharacterized protein n=1 Tax=Hymenolepis diminuta TaxID=6216 RepID=A0A564Z545_HYMDI|nr:unnamed protein product [Hymenolepis diminuta]